MSMYGATSYLSLLNSIPITTTHSCNEGVIEADNFESVKSQYKEVKKMALIDVEKATEEFQQKAEEGYFDEIDEPLMTNEQWERIQRDLRTREHQRKAEKGYMTREEAKRILESDLDHTFNDESKEALRMAIKALEQEPCEDAISREDALMALTGEIKETDTIETIIARFGRRIRKLSSVNPQPKTGHWRAVYQGDEIINYRCSECELGDTNGSTNLYGWDYCRRCGAKMIEPQERQGIDDYIDSIAESMKDEPLNFRVGRENVEPEDVPDIIVGNIGERSDKE